MILGVIPRNHRKIIRQEKVWFADPDPTKRPHVVSGSEHIVVLTGSSPWVLDRKKIFFGDPDGDPPNQPLGAGSRDRLGITFGINCENIRRSILAAILSQFRDKTVIRDQKTVIPEVILANVRSRW